MDETLWIKRKIFRGNKASLCSLFWTTHSPAETEALDSDDSYSSKDLPLYSSPIDDLRLEQLLQQIVPAEPQEQQLSSQGSIPEDYHVPGSFSSSANSNTQSGPEPVSPEECTAVCPGLELFLPCCTSVEDLRQETSLLQQCSDDKQGLRSSSPQPPPADPLKLGLSSIGCCCTVKLGLESSSLPHHPADPSDWQPRCAQLLSCNQPTKNPCSPARYPLRILDQKVCSLPHCSTTQLEQETDPPGLCPENPSRQETCPLYQLNDNSPVLGLSTTWQDPVQHLKLEASSGSQEDDAQQWCPTQQPLTEASSETQTSDRSTQGSSSPLHHPSETLELNPSSQQCHTTPHLKPESTPSKHCARELTRPEVSSAKHLPLDLNQTNSSPSVIFKKQPKCSLNSSRLHQADLPRTNCSSQDHLPGQSKPEPLPTSQHLTDQLMPDLSSKRHQPTDPPAHESFSPRHHQANCCRLESSQCHHIANTPRLDTYSGHSTHDSVTKATPDSSSLSHNPAADQQRQDSPSPRRHSAESRRLDSSSPRRHLETDWQRPDSSLRRHSADPPCHESSLKCHSAAERKRPHSSSRQHLAEDRQRSNSSSPRHLSTGGSRSHSSSPKHHSADSTRSDLSSPSHHSADSLRPDSFSPRRQLADPSRPSSSSPRRHSAFGHHSPDSSSPRRHSSDQQRLDSSSSRPHSVADRQRPDSCSTRRRSAADRPRSESSSQTCYSNNQLHPPRTEVYNVMNSLEDLPRSEAFLSMHLTEGQSSTDSSSESHMLAGQVRPDTSLKQCSAAKLRTGTLVQKHHPHPSLKLSDTHCSKPSFSTCDLSESTRLKPVPPNHSFAKHSEQHHFERGLPVPHVQITQKQHSHLPPPQNCSDCPSRKTLSTTHSQADGPQPASSRRHRPTDKTRLKTDKLPPHCSVDQSRSDLSSPQHISTDHHKPQSSLLHTQRACGESSVLLSKVKALKENRTLGKQTTITTLPQATQHSPKSCRTENLKTTVADEGHCEDAVVKPESQIRTYLTESLLICSEEMGSSEGLALTALNADGNAAMKLSESQLRDSWRPLGKPWERDVPKCSDITIKVTVTGGQRTAHITQHDIGEATQSEQVPNITYTPLSFAEQSQAREIKGKLGTPEENKEAPGDDTSDAVGIGGRLWRAESWDSLGSNTSSGSNTSMLTLAERVEWNRVLLKERLNATEPSHPHMESGKDQSSGSDRQIVTKADGVPGPLMSDADCDSGVSLQDSEGCRSAPPELLPLSARHDQAKQLLQRARMKARSGPLRASHHLLPPPEPGAPARDISIDQPAHQNSLLPDRAGPPSGSLSDSSSGDSSSGQQRRRQRGPSPSRVRFEDESAREAEARYLERQQQRQRRVLDSVMLSVGQGPLASKPDPSLYVKGDKLCGGERISKACRQQNCAQVMGHRGCGSREATTAESSPINLADLGKFGACGSSANSSEVSQTNCVVIVAGNQSLNKAGRIKEHQDAEKVVEPTTLNLEHTAPPLTSKGSPIWILPSRQRIHTERIRETYIGEVTNIDDIDSALDSTDTSDSTRTDSEEACSVNKRLIGRWGRTGRPINRCALITKSASAPKVEQDPSQVCRANQGFGELTTVGNEEGALNIAKGSSGMSRLAERGIEGKKLVGGVMIEDTEDFSFPLPSSSDQKNQRIEKGNVLSQNSGQGLVAPMPKPTDSCCQKKDLMERDTLLCSNEAFTTRSMIASEQIEKPMSPQCNISTHIPVPPAGKVPSHVPHRKAPTTENCKMANHVNGLPNYSPMQPAIVGSPSIPPPLSKPISCKKNSQSLTSVSTIEAPLPCLYPAVTSSVNPRNPQHISTPLSMKESDMLNPPVPDRLNNIHCVSALEIEGHEEQKQSSTAEREGSIKVQPKYASEPDGQRPSQATSSSAQKRSGKPQNTSMPMLKEQLSPHRTPGNDKKNPQSVGGATNEGNPKKSVISGSEGQRRVSRNSKAAKHQKTKLGALSTNNCNNTQMEQYQLSESLPREAQHGLDKHIIGDHRGCHMNTRGGVGNSIQDYSAIGKNSYEQNLLAGDASNMWQEYGAEASSVSRELRGDGVHLDPVGSTLSSTGISLSLMSDCVESAQTMEPTNSEATEETRNRSKRAAGDRTLPLKKDIDIGDELLPAARKRSGSTSSLKKFFSAIGQKTQQKLGRGRSASLEHIATSAATGETTPTTPKPPVRSESSKESIDHGMKKTPSLQSLKLVSPFRQLRKAASAQNLHSSPSKTDRSGSYLLEGPQNQRAGDRKDGNRPKRTLSVEDIGTPDQARTIGRVMEVFPDGTCQLELRRPPNGSFGFCISSGNGRPDTGVYIKEMADARTAKLYAGLLAVGDELLEVNEAKVAGLSLPALRDLIAQAETLSIRLLQQRRSLR